MSGCGLQLTEVSSTLDGTWHIQMWCDHNIGMAPLRPFFLNDGQYFQCFGVLQVSYWYTPVFWLLGGVTAAG